MRRIGVIGGTFAPIHNGHLLLARFALEEIPLNEVVFIPAADPPLKPGAFAPGAERLAMVEHAISGCGDFSASRVELDRPGKSYTVDTLKMLLAITASRSCPRMIFPIEHCFLRVLRTSG